MISIPMSFATLLQVMDEACNDINPDLCQCNRCKMASEMAVVDVCRGSLVRAQVGVRRGTEAILLHQDWIHQDKNTFDYYFI